MWRRVGVVTQKKIFLIKITVAKEQYISFIYFQIEVCAAGWQDQGPEVAPENLHNLSHQYLLFINTLFNKKNLQRCDKASPFSFLF